ncbi:hypothetical protein ACJX0J_008041, partial [Zea mays]
SCSNVSLLWAVGARCSWLLHLDFAPSASTDQLIICSFHRNTMGCYPVFWRKKNSRSQ